MEWAIGKGYDRYDGTGSSRSLARTPGISTSIRPGGRPPSELGIWYPKGQVSKKEPSRGLLRLEERRPALTSTELDCPHEGFTVLKENTVITNFQPHFHPRGGR
jgi:hypothetical protein